MTQNTMLAETPTDRMKLKQITKACYLNILTVNGSRAPCLYSYVLSAG